MKIAFFGSSLLSAYWNGAATYYRGLIKALHDRGHRVTFYEPDAYGRQEHRDMDPPNWCEVIVYGNQEEEALRQCEQAAKSADLLVKASGVGVFDEELEGAVLAFKRPGGLAAFWDVDAPATLERVHSHIGDAFRSRIPQYDYIFTYGGGGPVTRAYKALGARACVPIYNGLDAAVHHPVATRRYEADFAFLGNRLPDRESRVMEFFFEPAKALKQRKFLLGGNGWGDKVLPENVQYAGHVYTADHNAFNCNPLAVLNISRESMARYGFSPATRIFEAAGAGACVVSDAWEGLENFFEPGEEILVASEGRQVAQVLEELTPERGRTLGCAAMQRALREHTYANRAAVFETTIEEAPICV